jgi:hypothetical protein
MLMDLYLAGLAVLMLPQFLPEYEFYDAQLALPHSETDSYILCKCILMTSDASEHEPSGAVDD